MRFWLHEKTARGQASDCKKILFYFFVYLTGSGSHCVWPGDFLCWQSAKELIVQGNQEHGNSQAH